MSEIEGSEKLTQLYGSWPSFHDAEILNLTLDRSGPDAPTLKIQIHVFEMTSEMDPAGHFVLRDHRVVTLLFTRVMLEELRGFNEQNVIFSMDISSIDSGKDEGRHFSVDLSPSYGVGGSFECERVVVAAVESHTSAV